MRRAVFLDRDGVINRAKILDQRPFPPDSIADLEILPGVSRALRELKGAGYALIVVTNQPDVARGKTTIAMVEAINERLMLSLPIDRIYVCYHDNADACSCRKPQPGMLKMGAREFDVDLQSSFMIGDRANDIGAGINAGCRTIFVDAGYAETRPSTFDYKVSSLLEAADIILQEGI